MNKISRRSFLLGAGSLSALMITGFSGCTSNNTENEESVSAPASNDMPRQINLSDIRSHVIGVDTEIELEDGSKTPAINFDNAATTPAFDIVVDEINSQLAFYGSIGRGHGQKSVHSTEIYEAGRETIMDFFTADPTKYTVFYCGNTTDGINKLSSALITDKSDIVLTSRMEHHANDLPWRHRATPVYADVDDKGRLLLDDVERLLTENAVKYVSITATSNVTGYVNDVHAIAKLAHQHGAQIIVDGAQIAAHRAFDMTGSSEDEQIDFFLFSAHKMYAPFGGGAVIGLSDVLNEHLPQFYGGGTVDVVSDHSETYLSAPARYEAGSPNYPGVVAMIMAMDILKEVGFDHIVDHEQILLRKTIDGLLAIPNVTLYGDVENIDDKVGLVVFNIEGMAHGAVAEELAQRHGIATRQGAFCSHPYVWRLLDIPDNEIVEIMQEEGPDLPGMVRASFGIYNNEEEVDTFLETIRAIAANG